MRRAEKKVGCFQSQKAQFKPIFSTCPRGQPYSIMTTSTPKAHQTERAARLKKLFCAGRDLDMWRAKHAVTDEDFPEIVTALGWAHLLAGHQQREAARAKTPKKAASSRENGKLGGRPKRVLHDLETPEPAQKAA